MKKSFLNFIIAIYAIVSVNCVAFADAVAATASVAGTTVPQRSGSAFHSLMPLVIIMVIFYFILIRPQQKRLRSQQEMINQLKKGDKVVTTSGIIGIVSKINTMDNTISLEIAPDVRIQMQKQTITQVMAETKNVKDAKSE